MTYCQKCLKRFPQNFREDFAPTNWPSASEKFLIQAIFSSSVGKLAKSDEIMGKTSAVFLEKSEKNVQLL